MKILPYVLALLVGTFATSASAHEPRIVVTENFGGGEFVWERGTSNILLYRYAYVILEGELHVCGTLASGGSGQNNHKFNQLVMREAKVRVNGEVVLRSLGYFKWVSRRHISERLVGSEANCKGTGVMASSMNGLDVELEFRSGRYSL